MASQGRPIGRKQAAPARTPAAALGEGAGPSGEPPAPKKAKRQNREVAALAVFGWDSVSA